MSDKKCVYYQDNDDEPIEIEFDWDLINKTNKKLGLPIWYPDDYVRQDKNGKS